MQIDLFNCAEYTTIKNVDAVLSSNNQSGTLAEIALAKDAIKKGYTVYFPIGHSTKADLILMRNSKKPITVQVKKAVFQKEPGNYKILVGTGKPSCAYNKELHGLRYKKYQLGDFDVLACYIDDCDKFYFVELKDCLETATFRISPHTDKMNNWEVIERME
jgi:hypothetical protein